MEWLVQQLSAAAQGQASAVEQLEQQIHAHGVGPLLQLIEQDEGGETAFLGLCGLRLAQRSASGQAWLVRDGSAAVGVLLRVVVHAHPRTSALASELALGLALADEAALWHTSVLPAVLPLFSAQASGSDAQLLCLHFLRRGVARLVASHRAKPVSQRSAAHADRYTTESLRQELRTVAEHVSGALAVLPMEAPAHYAQAIRLLRHILEHDERLVPSLDGVYGVVERWLEAESRMDGARARQEVQHRSFKLLASAADQSRRSCLRSYAPGLLGLAIRALERPEASRHAVQYVQNLVSRLGRAQDGLYEEYSGGDDEDVAEAVYDARMRQLHAQFCEEGAQRLLHALVRVQLVRSVEEAAAWGLLPEESRDDMVGADPRAPAKGLLEALVAAYPLECAHMLLAEFADVFASSSPSCPLWLPREALYQALCCVANVAEGWADEEEEEEEEEEEALDLEERERTANEAESDGLRKELGERSPRSFRVIRPDQVLHLLSDDVGAFVRDETAEMDGERLVLASAAADVLEHWAFPLQRHEERGSTAIALVVRLLRVTHDGVRQHAVRALEAHLRQSVFRPHRLTPHLETLVSVLCAMVCGQASHLARQEVLRILAEVVVHAGTAAANLLLHDLRRALQYLWFATDGDALVRAHILRTLHRLASALPSPPMTEMACAFADLAMAELAHSEPWTAALWVPEAMALYLEALDGGHLSSSLAASLCQNLRSFFGACRSDAASLSAYVRVVRASLLLGLAPAELLMDLPALSADLAAAFSEADDASVMLRLDAMRLADVVLALRPDLAQACAAVWQAAVAECVEGIRDSAVEYRLVLAALWSRLVGGADPLGAAPRGLLAMYVALREGLPSVARMRLVRNPRYAMDLAEVALLRARYAQALAQTLHLCAQLPDAAVSSLPLLNPVATMNALISFAADLDGAAALSSGRVSDALRALAAVDPSLSPNWTYHLGRAIELLVRRVGSKDDLEALSDSISSLLIR